MELYSTNYKSPLIPLEETVMNGIASDGGLFMPKIIPRLSKTFFQKLPKLTLQEIAYEVTKVFLQGDVPTSTIKKMIVEVIQFYAPIKTLGDNLHSLELFNGPTMSFKDFGAFFIARLISYYASYSDKVITILVATSGDTGSAVAAGFYNIPNVKVVILYPKGKVSHIQEQQLTTIGGNIVALEIKGTFDDCQQLVKEALLDNNLDKKLTLTSANSINIARLLGQLFYYFYAYGKVAHGGKPVVFSVPCGNLGNLTAGIIAKRMGLPITKFIAATNINDVFPIYMQTGLFKVKPSKSTLSNAMDVGNPSNFTRILDLYNHDIKRMRKDIWSKSFSDKETLYAIQHVWKVYRYMLDPHGAVAYLGLETYMKRNPNTIGIFLETAHPAKFNKILHKATGKDIPLPKSLRIMLRKKKKTTILSNRYTDFKNYLLKTI